MKVTQHLPEDYREVYAVDLEKNKKSALYVNLLAVLITILMVIGMNFIIPLSSLFEDHLGAPALIVRMLVMIALLIAYIVLHEVTHGIAMKLCGCKKITYGFSGMYAYACASEFFRKTPYLFVALSPVFLWGVVLSVVGLLVPESWFWVFYVIQIANIAGAAGDYYVAFHFFYLPDDILVYDTGTAMTVYSQKVKK